MMTHRTAPSYLADEAELEYTAYFEAQNVFS